MKKYSSILAMAVALLLWFSPVNSLATQGPMEQLRPTLSMLTSVLADPELRGDEKKVVRRAKIMDSIKSGFDFEQMCRRILGGTWNKISVDEQKLFTELMTKLLENVYIGKLENYSGQTIGYVGERVKGDRAQVSTLIEDDRLQIPVHYIMSLDHGKWMVYDINIEGVSLVRNYMQQFKSILRKEKFEGLIKVLQDKNRSFETNS